MQSHINVRKEPTQRISFYMTNFGKFLLVVFFFPFSLVLTSLQNYTGEFMHVKTLYRRTSTLSCVVRIGARGYFVMSVIKGDGLH